MNGPHFVNTGNSDRNRRLRLLAWEMTAACPFSCPHCRASACAERLPGELTTGEGEKLLADAAKVGSAIIIFSGGEPLLRPDLDSLIAAAVKCGHTPVVACNDGRMLDEARIMSLKESGVRRFSFSIHSFNSDEYDEFTGVSGAYSNALAAFKRLISAKIPFQINTTVLPENAEKLADFRKAVISLGACAWHLFFTVPTGRAVETSRNVYLDPATTEKVLRWTANVIDDPGLPMKVTCAPQFARIRAEMGGKNHTPGSRSCMAGNGFAFVSWKGDVKPCGYFDLIVGNIRTTPFNQIFTESEILIAMSDSANLQGKCGICEYKNICGGCRARAFSATGTINAEDPACNYSPAKRQV